MQLSERLPNSSNEIVIPQPVKFLSSVLFSELPETPINEVVPGATELNVLNVTRLKLQSTGAVTITKLTKGQEGQLVAILGDGNSTLENNATIVTNTGANKLLEANRIYVLVQFDGVWYEQATPAELTAGDGIEISAGAITNKYTGKHVSLVTNPYNHTFVGAFSDTTFGTYDRLETLQSRADLTKLTQFRMSGWVESGSGLIFLQYNIGAGWVTIDTDWLDTFSGTPPAWFSGGGYVSLPSAARVADVRIAPCVTGNIEFSALHLEFIP